MTERDEVWLVRHGETEWSASGLHTSFTDLPLTEHGVETARELGARLQGESFAQVLTSPRARAHHTAELAGFGDALIEEDIVEWGYGEYEGISTLDIRKTVPGWTVWTHSSPGGEAPDEISARLDRVVARVRGAEGRTLIFAHSHSLRAFTARWLGQSVSEGRFFKLDTATISVLGYERETPVMLRWNS